MSNTFTTTLSLSEVPTEVIDIDVSESPTEVLDINVSGSADEIITLITDTSLLPVNRIVYNKASLLYRVFLSGTFEDNGIPTPANLIGQTVPITLATESVYNDDWEIEGTGETGGDAFFEIDVGLRDVNFIAAGINRIDDLGGTFTILLDAPGLTSAYGGTEHLAGFDAVIANSDEPQYDGAWTFDPNQTSADGRNWAVNENGFGNTTTDAGSWTINDPPERQELTGTDATIQVEVTRETITIGVS